jgi:RHS repeat-associated protein
MTLMTRTRAEMLDETGFVLLGARIYSSEVGRWLSPDPAGLGSPYV